MYSSFSCILYLFVFYCFFFFKQKTAYEMRISDWSSDVCSSDLCVLDRDRRARIGEGFLDGTLDVGLPLRIAPVERRHDAVEHRLFPLQRAQAGADEIGRASCRERVCQYV